MGRREGLSLDSQHVREKLGVAVSVSAGGDVLGQENEDPLSWLASFSSSSRVSERRYP